MRDRVATAREEFELWMRKLRCSVPVEMRVETTGVANRLTGAAGPGGNRAPMLVLGKKTPSSKGGSWPGTIVNRVLSGGTVPILMYVADQIVRM
jgi:hypothetical protein